MGYNSGVRTLLAVLTLLSGSVTAGPLVDEAASALKRDPVFVHPAAERPIDESQARAIRGAIAEGNAPVFVAVLPTSAEDEVSGGLNGLPRALGEAVGFRGTYAVVTGKGFRAASNALPEGVAAEIATATFNDQRDDGPAAVLLEFVRRVDRAQAEGSGGSTAPEEKKESNPVAGGLLLAGLAGGGVYLFRRKKKKDAERRQILVGEQEDLRSELAVLADDVLRLEPEVELNPEARGDYEAGVARFKWAQAAIDSIDSPDDPPRVRRGMAEAQYAMARARAHIRGHDMPAPPEELQRPGPYGEPAVELDERREPVYAGYGGYGGGWGGGGYFGGNGMFTGLLLGSMLSGGGWGGGFGFGGGGYDRPQDQGNSGWDGGSSGGDWGGGGGDFGGGGGGDFGGGDSGGGDW